MVNNDLRAKAIAGLKIHTDNWDTDIKTFIQNCNACPYHTKPMDPSTKGCVYTLLKDALTVLEGEEQTNE